MDRTSDAPIKGYWMSFVFRKMVQHTEKDTWEIKVVPQLNHDLFSFTSAMKNGWQMNGRWKKNGIEIELFKSSDGIF